MDQGFRALDRSVREQIATWESSKGALLAEFFGERDHIGDSAQGRSFRAFWDFLMSPPLQEERTSGLERVLVPPPLGGTSRTSVRSTAWMTWPLARSRSRRHLPSFFQKSAITS